MCFFQLFVFFFLLCTYILIKTQFKLCILTCFLIVCFTNANAIQLYEAIIGKFHFTWIKLQQLSKFVNFWLILYWKLCCWQVSAQLLKMAYVFECVCSARSLSWVWGWKPASRVKVLKAFGSWCWQVIQSSEKQTVPENVWFWIKF